MNRIFSALLILIGLSITGCGTSPPTHFYTLDAHDASEPASPKRVALVTLGQINLPHVLDRDEIVREAAPNQLAIAPFERWAAPLDEIVRQALTVDLERQLPPGALIRSNGSPSDTSIGVINFDFDRFESDTSGHVTLTVSWNVTRGNPATTVTRHDEHITVTAANAGFPAMTDAMSQALAELAQRIAAELPESSG